MKWYWWLMIGTGPLVGMLGAFWGVTNSVKQSKGPRERRFIIRASIWMSVGLLFFLGGLLLIPQPWNLLLWIPYGLGLGFVIRFMNVRQAQIRALDMNAHPPLKAN